MSRRIIHFDIITIFPEVFKEYFNTSIIKRAQQKKLVKIKIHNLRDFTTDKHRTVDDKPYGGGPGMILKIEPIYKAIRSILRISNFQFLISKQVSKSKIQKPKTRIILLSPAGKQFDQKMAQSLSQLNQLIFICGRYEGVDARVEKFVDEKISVGPYVLTGGELPTMTIVDAITRLIPGAIRPESLEEETFSTTTNYKLGTNVQIPKNSSVLNSYIRKKFVIRSKERSDSEYPQFTRPEALTIRGKNGKIKKVRVPKVLLSGNHQEIKKWREKCQNC